MSRVGFGDSYRRSQLCTPRRNDDYRPCVYCPLTYNEVSPAKLRIHDLFINQKSSVMIWVRLGLGSLWLGSLGLE